MTVRDIVDSVEYRFSSVTVTVTFSTVSVVISLDAFAALKVI